MSVHTITVSGFDVLHVSGSAGRSAQVQGYTVSLLHRGVVVGIVDAAAAFDVAAAWVGDNPANIHNYNLTWVSRQPIEAPQIEVIA